MEGYRAKTRSRLYVLVALLTFVIIFIPAGLFMPRGVVVGFSEYPAASVDVRFYEFVEGLSAAFYALLVLALFLRGFRCFRSLRNDEALRRQYIREHDERTAAIQNRVGGTGYSIVLALVTVGAFATAYLHRIDASIALLSVLGTMAVTKGALKMYYHRKI